MVVARPPEPVDFRSIDGELVHTMFVVVAPTVAVHLALLSRLAFCLQDDRFVEMLAAAAPEHHFWPELDRVLDELATRRPSGNR